MNICVLVLRRDRVGHDHFHAPSILPILGASASLFLVLRTIVTDSNVAVRACVVLAFGVALFS